MPETATRSRLLASTSAAKPAEPRLQRFLRLAEVIEATGLAAPTIYEHMAAGKFPRQVQLAPDWRNAKRRAVGWVEAEIVEWQQRRISERDAVVKAE
jgi:prophage regulatory protein